MKKRYGYLGVILALVGLGLLPVCSGCSSAPNEGFAIYLTRNSIPPSQMESMSHVDLADAPIIAGDDIVSYNAQTHEITLSPEAFARVAELKIPTTGRSFLVCVDQAPVYWGAFWALYSSQSFDGVTIGQPLNPQGPPVIKIGLGYPGASFYRQEDPRSDPVILESLAQAGKLIDPR
jgi:hypothetical protein